MKRINFQHPETGKPTIGIVYNDYKLSDDTVKVVCAKSAKGFITIDKKDIINTWND